MHHHTKAILALLTATALLALAISDASARSFSFTEKNFEQIWNNAITGKQKLTFGDNAGHKVECNLTLLGRQSATIAKNTAINQGTINHGSIEGCVGGTATIRTETMPWPMRYAGFTGRLPNITTITDDILGLFWRLRESGGLECTSRTEELEPGVGIIEGAGLENVRADETRTIALGGGFLCGFASPGHFAGRGLLLNLPRTANITITLI